MESTSSGLLDQIRNAIRQSGAVTFEWFMDQALYHPDAGYYASGRCAIGRAGDYFTNVSVGPLFGRLLAAQFREMWMSLERPDPFVIVEQGAHHGDFARDVLEAIRTTDSDLFSSVQFSIIEPFPILRDRQEKTLRDFGKKVRWANSLSDHEPFSGVHFSNELLDAMPVHLVLRTSGGWEERRVVEAGDGFDFVNGPITNPELEQYLRSIPSDLPERYETELNLRAPKWIKEVGSKLVRGFILIVDYGYSHNEYYAAERNKGTLRCYAQHRSVASPFISVGEVDITAHVNWTTLVENAERHEFRLVGFTDQHHFITGIVTNLLRPDFEEETNPKVRRALQTLLHPELLGTTFQFLGLTKCVQDATLSGFKFARDPRATLGL